MSHRSKVTHFAAVYVPHHHETRHLMSPMKNKVNAPSLGIINMDADHNSELFVKQNDSGVHLPPTLYPLLHGLHGHLGPCDILFFLLFDVENVSQISFCKYLSLILIFK